MYLKGKTMTPNIECEIKRKKLLIF